MRRDLAAPSRSCGPGVTGRDGPKRTETGVASEMNGHRVSGARATGVAMLAGLLLMPTGCVTQQPAATRASAQKDGTPATAPAGEQFRTTVARSALRERAISELLDLAASNDPQVRANTLEAMLPARSRLVAPVAAGLADENEGVRAVSAVVAGRAGLRELEPALQGRLTDSSPYVRAGAIFAMRKLGIGTDPTPLGGLLLGQPDLRVRAHAAYLLGELGDKSALPMLQQALHSKLTTSSAQEERLLGLQIAEAMVKLGDESRIEGIRAALYPAYPDEFEVAALAVQILGRLGDRSSIGALINLAEYHQGGRGMPPEIRLAVADAVARMGRREGWFIADAYLNDKDPLRRALAAQVLGQTRRPQDLETLSHMLDDPSPAVRVAASGAVLEALSAEGGLREAVVEP